MKFPRIVRQVAAVGIAASLPLASALAQDTHVVPLSELHSSVVAKGEQRQKNLAQLDQFFAGEASAKTLESAHLSGTQVRSAVALLNDEELARLAARAEKASSDFAAGALNNQQLTYIIIALATAVIILIIVAA